MQLYIIETEKQREKQRKEEESEKRAEELREQYKEMYDKMDKDKQNYYCEKHKDLVIANKNEYYTKFIGENTCEKYENTGVYECVSTGDPREDTSPHMCTIKEECLELFEEAINKK